MAILENSIAGIQFDDMTGIVIPIAEEVEVFQRAGIDGIGARKKGKHGEPFALVSVQYVLSFNTARLGLEVYRDTHMGGDPVPVVFQGEAWGSYLVLDVRENEPSRAVRDVIGAIIPNATVRQVLRWTLHGG